MHDLRRLFVMSNGNFYQPYVTFCTCVLTDKFSFFFSMTFCTMFLVVLFLSVFFITYFILHHVTQNFYATFFCERKSARVVPGLEL